MLGNFPSLAWAQFNIFYIYETLQYKTAEIIILWILKSSFEDRILNIL